MKYKYKRTQIFRKSLHVSKVVRNKVYNSTLSLKELINYDLSDKIPASCLIPQDRVLLEKFGADKFKNFDWELEEQDLDINLREMIMDLDSNVEDINTALYEQLKDKIKPSQYTTAMKKAYPKRVFEIDMITDDSSLTIKKSNFNEGETTIEDLLRDWSLYEDKDLSFCLNNDEKNKSYNITEKELRDFVGQDNYLLNLFYVSNRDIYEIIRNFTDLKGDEKHAFIKEITDSILENYEIDDLKYNIDDEYLRTIFKYSSLTDFLKKNADINSYLKDVIKEMESLPNDYILNSNIPINYLWDSNVNWFTSAFGLKNTIDFDNECGHFFSNNDCEVLRSLAPMFLHYSGGIFKLRDHYTGTDYTKDEFYEVIKKILMHKPTDFNYENKFFNYSMITGKFRKKYPDIFIDDNAPEELKNKFYTKSLTPQDLRDNPSFISYIKNKNLSLYFKERKCEIIEKNSLFKYDNLYSFILNKTDFDTTIKFITDYADVLDCIYQQSELKLQKDANFDDIKKTIIDSYRDILIKTKQNFSENVPESLKQACPSLFLPYDAPSELKEAFYKREVDANFILNHPEYHKYLKQIDLELIYQYMPVSRSKTNLIKYIKDTFGPDESFDLMLIYGKYIEASYNSNDFANFKFKGIRYKDYLLDEIDASILKSINQGSILNYEHISTHFKNNYPTLFLSEDVSKDIRDKFYNKKLTLQDFIDNPKLIDSFKNTNLIYGLDASYLWLATIFTENKDNLIDSNNKRLQVSTEFSKVSDSLLRNTFKDYIKRHETNLDFNKLEYVSSVLSRLSTSNSAEMFRLRIELADELLELDNPIDGLNKIEDIFIKNNIPTVGKVYYCFETLHPDFKGFNFENSAISPILKKSGNRTREIIIFSDLIRAAFGSNNRSINEYLNEIEEGSILYRNITSGNINYDSLTTEQNINLQRFSKALITLYNNTKKGKKMEYSSSGNILDDVDTMVKGLSPDGSLDYNLPNRLIRMFCGFAGIDTLEEARGYINNKVLTADARNREAAKSNMNLEQGDFVKGIGKITYLRNILQNGSVAKEFLGSNANSDRTPLDTDLSMIQIEGTISEKLDDTAAKDYGPIWFVLKNDDRFLLTRDSEKKEYEFHKKDFTKLETFCTGALGKGHYGIRTGFASSDINYIMMESFDPRVGLEIAMNGFYIPVVNKEGKITFTPDDYDNLREKMSGLSYFGEYNFKLSDNLLSPEVSELASKIEESNNEVVIKRGKINQAISETIGNLGLSLKSEMDGDLTDGSVELIDTGSTGRGTNKPGDGDFDFMMRLDKSIISNPKQFEELRQHLLDKFKNAEDLTVTNTGDLRLKKVQLDENTNVDIDISFVEKSDKIDYSTDMAVRDRLNTIKNNNPEQYDYVIANIITAKNVLKEAQVYKPDRGPLKQGGLGGIGIENWILQNGGSFVDAAKSFVEAAEGKSFSEFTESYRIWDFGDNHFAEKKGYYPHDNFVRGNMSADGYKKMVSALKTYLATYNYDVNTDSSDMHI